RVKHQPKPVDAIAQAGRLRSVVEDVTHMSTAAAAVDFRARHPERRIPGFANGVVERLVEAWPAGAALEFGIRGEQGQIAAGAGEDTLAFFLQERARTRPLGAVLAQDFI